MLLKEMFPRNWLLSVNVWWRNISNIITLSCTLYDVTSNDGAMGGFEMDENMNEYIHTCCIQMSGIFLISYFIHNPNGGGIVCAHNFLRWLFLN